VTITFCNKLAANDSAEWTFSGGAPRRYVESYQLGSDNPDESKITVLNHDELPAMITSRYPGDPAVFIGAERNEQPRRTVRRG
jgi:hypothetical protein